MTDIRHDADAAAREAFRRMLAHHLRTGEWNQALIAEWSEAEALVDAVPEWMLDANHDALMAAMDELADAEGLPDVPLAAMTEAEARWAWGDR